MVRRPLLAALPYVADEAEAPLVPLVSLDTVWLQLTGTLCNIACLHCFITCGPNEDRVPMMASDAVRKVLAEAAMLGVRDYYFTGGEPMMHPDFWALCEETLMKGPLTVLTNGLLIDEQAADRARAIFDRAAYSFDLRVSLDGMNAEENDPVRGRGTFAAITASLERLAARGLSPSITVVEHRAGMADESMRLGFLEFARSLGLKHPRVKFLPLLRIGREPRRTRGYAADELDCLRSPDPLDAATLENLVCSSSRLVTPTGVMTCPILLDAPGARLGDTLAEASGPIRLRWSACRTCLVDGLTCRT
jgi:molybdenum cofactor biosynthesis enzyme MoaA